MLAKSFGCFFHSFRCPKCSRAQMTLKNEFNISRDRSLWLTTMAEKLGASTHCGDVDTCVCVGVCNPEKINFPYSGSEETAASLQPVITLSAEVIKGGALVKLRLQLSDDQRC